MRLIFMYMWTCQNYTRYQINLQKIVNQNQTDQILFILILMWIKLMNSKDKVCHKKCYYEN